MYLATMKPPRRQRTVPSRFHKTPEQEQIDSARSLCKGWNRKDLHSFLQALKQQQDFESEIDLTEIQKKIPQRSLKQIENLINKVKLRVLQKVFKQVKSQRKKERKAKVPIETWGEMVQKISTSHGKTISAAFSQMLVVAATEPCSLMHSEPPHPVTQTPVFSRLYPAYTPNTPSRPTTSGVSPSSSVSTASAVSFIRPDSSSSAAGHIGKSDTVSSSLHQEPVMPEASTPTSSSSQSRSEAEAAVSSPVSSRPSPSTSSNKPSPISLELLGHDYPCKPRIMKSVVNFDKIYAYLSDMDSKTCSSALSSMECAVLLDLLMCLPEELPLLDCKGLQHHLLQLHSQLSKPTVKPESYSNGPLSGEANSSTSAQKPSAAAGSSEKHGPVKDSDDWASAGICPLNPLSVPVTLLKRKSVDCDK